MNDKRLVFNFELEGSRRLDQFLNDQMPDHSRSFLQKLIKDGKVSVDGEIVSKSGTKLNAVHQIEVFIPPSKPSNVVPENIPLDILYEDQDVIVINKSPGMVVHPSAGHSSGTLVNAVLAHSNDIQGVGGELRPGVVHRLDKDTSGVIALAKNDKAHRYLQSQFKKRSVEKKYWALVDGRMPTPSGRIEAPIGRDPKNRQRMAVVPDNKGRRAVSEYSTMETFHSHTYIEVNLLTGRTHQIRVHLAFMNTPIVGDRVYGKQNPTLPADRQLLHAAFLSIELPGNRIKKNFHAPLPEDFANILKLLRT